MALDACDREDHGHGHHDAGKHKIGGWVIPSDHMTDSHESMATLGNNTHGDEEIRIPMNVGRATKESNRHREIEDAGDLDLPDVERRPWRNCSEEPSRKGRSRDTDDEMTKTPAEEEHPQERLFP